MVAATKLKELIPQITSTFNDRYNTHFSEEEITKVLEFQWKSVSTAASYPTEQKIKLPGLASLILGVKKAKKTLKRLESVIKFRENDPQKRFDMSIPRKQVEHLKRVIERRIDTAKEASQHWNKYYKGLIGDGLIENLEETQADN